MAGLASDRRTEADVEVSMESAAVCACAARPGGEEAEE
jgi:hypothetical protein